MKLFCTSGSEWFHSEPEHSLKVTVTCFCLCSAVYEFIERITLKLTYNAQWNLIQ